VNEVSSLCLTLLHIRTRICVWRVRSTRASAAGGRPACGAAGAQVSRRRARKLPRTPCSALASRMPVSSTSTSPTSSQEATSSVLVPKVRVVGFLAASEGVQRTSSGGSVSSFLTSSPLTTALAASGGGGQSGGANLPQRGRPAPPLPEEDDASLLTHRRFSMPVHIPRGRDHASSKRCGRRVGTWDGRGAPRSREIRAPGSDTPLPPKAPLPAGQPADGLCCRGDVRPPRWVGASNPEKARRISVGHTEDTKTAALFCGRASWTRQSLSWTRLWVSGERLRGGAPAQSACL
jgi:hypothetical protein